MAPRFPMAQSLSSRMRRLVPWRRSQPADPATPMAQETVPRDPLVQAGRTLRQAREAQGLGLRELAQSTRISTPVLEALERGWRERLPEAAYLRTMLPLLEQHLDLPAGSLDVAFPRSARHRRDDRRGGAFLQRFTPGSIDVFTTWQGTLLYGVLTLGLVYAINLQQQRIALKGWLSLRPLEAPDPPTATAEGSDGNLLLKAFPDLRPLQQADAGLALERLRRESGGKGPSDTSGLLRLRLTVPTSVRLQPRAGPPSTLSEVSGELTLVVRPPFQLTLSPAVGTGSVLWNGRPLSGAANSSRTCLLYTSPSPRDATLSRMPSSA